MAVSLSAQLASFAEQQGKPMNRKGEADVPLQAGHVDEPVLAGGFVDYELAPRAYELSLTQTVLRVHSRVADLYNSPMNPSWRRSGAAAWAPTGRSARTTGP